MTKVYQKSFYITCLNCNGWFKAWASQVQRGKAKYCSVECTRAKAKTPWVAINAAVETRKNNLWWRDKISGQNHYRWRGGKTSEIYKARQEFKKIRSKIIERDKVCQDCNKWDKRKAAMHVHHIDYNCINNNLKNLVLLCRSCHAKRHTKKVMLKYRESFLL